MRTHYVYYIQEEPNSPWKYIGYKIKDKKYKSIFPKSLSGHAKLKYTELDVMNMIRDTACVCRVMPRSEFVELVLLDVL
jgi:hypothetical protein